MAMRIAEYNARIHFREGLPVWSIVIYLKPTEALPSSPYTTTLPDGRINYHCDFDVVTLWTLPSASVLETPYTDLWPLAVLMAGTNAERVVAVARQIATAPITIEQQEKLEGLVVLFAGLRMPVAPLAHLLQEDTMLKDIFQHSSLRELLIQEVGEEKLKEGFKQGFDQGIQQGIQQGMQQSIQQGIEQGQLLTLRQMVTLLAQQQFSDLSAVARERIAACTDSVRLQDAALAMASFADEAALLAYLPAVPTGRADSGGTEPA